MDISTALGISAITLSLAFSAKILVQSLGGSYLDFREQRRAENLGELRELVRQLDVACLANKHAMRMIVHDKPSSDDEVIEILEHSRQIAASGRPYYPR